MNVAISALPERIQQKIYVEPNTGCWLWLGALAGGNWADYPVIGRKGRNIYVHRLTYEFFIGPVPDGKQLDHLCRTRCCCNPLHLEPVTPKTNINRGRRFNAEKTHCKRGHEFTPENTYVTPSTGTRHCRICNRLGMMRYYQEHK